MRWGVVAALLLASACVNPDPDWERQTGWTLELSLLSDAQPGLTVDADWPFDPPNDDVLVEWWSEQRLSERASREEWFRLRVRDLPVTGLTCDGTPRLTMWWDDTDWEYGLRIDGFDAEPIEAVVENSGSQIDRFGFIRGTFDITHPCVADGETVAHEVSATWNLSTTERGLQTPPPDERR